MSNRFVEKMRRMADLSEGDRAALTTLTRDCRAFRAKRDLVREGDAPGPMLIVLDGWACRYKTLPDGMRQIVAFMMPGDACDPHVDAPVSIDHSIQALTDVQVCIVQRTALAALMEQSPEVARAIYTAQLVEEGTLRERIVSMGRRTSIARVAHLICELYLRLRAIGLAENDVMQLPLSQLVLADALGMTPVHINRVIRTLRESRITKIHHGMVEILDRKGLEKTAGFDESYLHREMRV